MKEFMYNINSFEIAIILLISMVLAMELGFRLGRKSSSAVDNGAKEHINTIQASILGILALLLGFTFSISLERFDSRSEAVALEANAIGTTYLRAQLLPVEVRDETMMQLRQYLDLRVEASGITLIDTKRDELLAKTAMVQKTLWAQAKNAAELAPNPVTSGLFIQSLNDMFDDLDMRNAALNRHVPELVLMLLYATFVMSGAIVGFASGVAGHRPSVVSYIMVVLIVVLVFIIIDLDRPRRGLIQVSQKSLLDLQASIKSDAGTAQSASLPQPPNEAP